MTKKTKKSKHIFFDTNIFIQFYRDEHSLLRVSPYFPGIYAHFAVSKVVLMELWAGARNEQEKSRLQRLEKEIPLLGLDDSAFVEAGKILCRMNEENLLPPKERRRITWDILIALCAQQNQATVLTNNAKDFSKIQKFVDFDFVAVN